MTILHTIRIQTDKIEPYLGNIPSPKLTNKQTLSSKGIKSEDEVFKSFKSMENNKSPGNDGISKEFYESFWDEIKKLFLASIHKAFSTSQKQAVIKILGKKDKDKRFIEKWRPMSLLNRDMKIISKVLSTRINETAYVKNRFISKSGRAMSEIFGIANTLALQGFLVTVDIEKAFDSVNHRFLLQNL